MASSHGRGNEASYFIKDSEFLHHPGLCQLLKKGYSPWREVEIKIKICGILDSHSSIYEDFYLLGYRAV
jgi:hypothetical protein